MSANIFADAANVAPAAKSSRKAILAWAALFSPLWAPAAILGGALWLASFVLVFLPLAVFLEIKDALQQSRETESLNAPRANRIFMHA